MSEPIAVVVSKPQTIVVHSIQQGPPGPPGGGTIVTPAGQDLSGHRIVCLNSTGQAVYADKDFLATVQQVLGLTTGAALSGTSATLIPAGEITEPSWSLEPSMPVYLGNNGLLTQAVPATGAILQVGVALAASRLLIDMKMPIIQI